MLGLHLVKCLAATQGPKIRVNAVLPGLLLTEWVIPSHRKLVSASADVWEGANFTPETIKIVKDKAYLKKEVRENHLLYQGTRNNVPRRTSRTVQMHLLLLRKIIP